MNDFDTAHVAQSAHSSLHASVYGAWLRLGLARRLKARRMKVIGDALGIDLFGGDSRNILEIGCGSGRDFIRPLEGSPHRLWGLDHVDVKLAQPNFTFIHGDAATVPFEDGFFDGVVSIGVLEHVEPIEHLCEVVQEHRRVARRYAVIVPSINTVIEPHKWSPYWQLRRVREIDQLNYFSDMAWHKFRGFAGAKIRRFDYMPGLITNLVIYGEGGSRA